MALAEVQTVLILILLEYGLRPCELTDEKGIALRLNPYSTGIWSATLLKETQKTN